LQVLALALIASYFCIDILLGYVSCRCSAQRQAFARLTISEGTVMRQDLAAVPAASREWTLDTGEALARLAHELRTPLATMLTATELLADDLGELDAQQVRAMVATIHRSTCWLQQLMEQLHDGGTAADGSATRQPIPLDLREVLEEVEPLVRAGLAAKGQQLAVIAPASLPCVVADRQQFGQVWVNLLVNASKFADPATRLEVRLTCEGDALRAAVADRGPGFPDGCAAQLFEPYYQAATPVAASQRGVGLGLAIVQAIVQAHGGRVGAENRRGGGARVWFELPVPPEASAVG
jgi:signal transduction histidine kinase